MAVVMFSGCSRPTGFGQRTALAFAKAGHEVYATMRKPERGAALEKQAVAADLVSIVAPSFFDTGMSANTVVDGQYQKGTPYDAFNQQIAAATIAGEDAGEDPQLVADMILEAATTGEPRLRWWPGEQGPGLAAARRAMSDADWQPMMTGEMKLGWWVEGREPE